MHSFSFCVAHHSVNHLISTTLRILLPSSFSTSIARLFNEVNQLKCFCFSNFTANPKPSSSSCSTTYYLSCFPLKTQVSSVQDHIVISECLERHSKAKHTRAPAYSRALRKIKEGSRTFLRTFPPDFPQEKNVNNVVQIEAGMIQNIFQVEAGLMKQFFVN